ncbi:hypothetical protein DL98DRAFT_534275 [Cadophora sp. DSE1049]|nr:hypothetical protein DL98DRAFT_534275 [Cadophora sp. DSE1049]
MAGQIDRQDSTESPPAVRAKMPAPTFVKPESEIRFLVASQTIIDLTVFHMFPFLPMELRLKIWKAMLPGALSSISEFLQSSGYEILHFKHNLTKRTWINYSTDTLFLNTNARDPADGGDDQELVLPPTDFPLSFKVKERIKTIAVSYGLWFNWFFLEDYGTDITCDHCYGYGDDNTKKYWRNDFCRDLKADKVQLVLSYGSRRRSWRRLEFKKGVELDGLEDRFRKGLKKRHCEATVEIVEARGA